MVRLGIGETGRRFNWCVLAMGVMGLALLVPGVAAAQSLRGFGVKVGVASAGVSYCQSNSSVEVCSNELQRRIGFEVLTHAEWFSHPVFSVVTEVGYVQRGFMEEEVELRDEQNLPAGQFRPSVRFGYVRVDALIKVRYDLGSISPYVAAGPGVDVLIHSSGQRAAARVVGGETETHPLVEAYDSFAFGPTIGFGTEINGLIGRRLLAEIRYARDITDSLSEATQEARNNALSVVLGVTL